MSSETMYIWMDGKMLDAEHATVPFMNSALHYGLGVFEGIRCYNTDRGPAIFRLREHMERLVDSAHVLGMRELPYSVDEMMDATRQVVKANDLKECYIRPLIYHHNPSLGLNLDAGTIRLGISAWEWGAYLGKDALEKGIRANIASFTRHHPNVTMTKAKVTGNYANSTLAKTESLRLGFEEAIMLDPQGYVAECSGENIFMVRRGAVYTPPLAAVLEGITRDSLITLADELGYPINEQPIGRDMLYIADEVFVCGTAAEVIAIREIDFRTIGEGKMGPVTGAIQKAFHGAVRGQDHHAAEWMDYVNEH
jgi:branched-chain amino acid aminotransferase